MKEHRDRQDPGCSWTPPSLPQHHPMGITPSSPPPAPPCCGLGKDGAVTSVPIRGCRRAACCSLAARLCSVTQHTASLRTRPPRPYAPHRGGTHPPILVVPSPSPASHPGPPPAPHTPPPKSCTAPLAAALSLLQALGERIFYIYLLFFSTGEDGSERCWGHMGRLGIFKASWSWLPGLVSRGHNFPSFCDPGREGAVKKQPAPRRGAEYSNCPLVPMSPCTEPHCRAGAVQQGCDSHTWHVPTPGTKHNAERRAPGLTLTAAVTRRESPAGVPGEGDKRGQPAGDKDSGSEGLILRRRSGACSQPQS